MFMKTCRIKYIRLLILLAFCLSSATLGGPLFYGSNIHLGHHSVHVHHSESGQCVDEGEDDKSLALYYDYLTISPSNSIETYPDSNFYLYSIFIPTYNNNFFNTSSRITCYSNINRFCLTNLYQLKSSYLI